MSFELYELESWALFAVVFGSLVVSMEIGHGVGARLCPSYDQPCKEQLGSLQAGILGIVGLILGFAFSVALARFDERRELVVKDANAIGVAYLRCDILRASEQAHCRKLLLRYADLRIELFEQRKDHGSAPEHADHETTALQSELWGIAERVAAEDPRHVVSLFVGSVNNLVDVNTARTAAMLSYIPKLVSWVLLTFVTVGIACASFASAVLCRRRIGMWYALATLLSSMLLLIYDLDRPVRGSIPVDHGALYYQRSLMH